MSSNKHVLVYGAHPVCCGNENIHLQKLDFANKKQWFSCVGGSFPSKKLLKKQMNYLMIMFFPYSYSPLTMVLDYWQKHHGEGKKDELGSFFTSS